MKLLTVQIGNNIIETLDFEHLEYKNSFIIQSSSQIDLLEIPLESPVSRNGQKGIVVQISTGRKMFYPTSLTVSKIEQNKENGVDLYEVILGLTPNPKEEESLFDENNDPNMYFVFSQGKLSCENIAVERISEVRVGFQLKDESSELCAWRTIYLAQNIQISDVILDFGSEATQLNIGNRDEINDINKMVPLFDHMWSDLSESEADKNDCMQLDAGDECLYRSRFFVKRQMEKCDSEELEAHAYGAPSKNQYIKLLTLSKDGEHLRDEYLPLPNTKIANFGGVRVDSIDMVVEKNGISRIVPVQIKAVGDNFFYRSSINAFLRKAIDLISEQNLVKITSKQIRLLSFHILMPNVYDYTRVHETLRNIQKDLERMIADVDDNIVGFELSAVSESDASFLGNVAVSTPDEFPGGKYLILDAGRGTLDFSIIKHDTNTSIQRFQNLYRDGIIGAGNALTYAMLLVVLEGLANIESGGEDHTDKIQKYIYSNILGLDASGKKKGGGDSAQLVKLMELLDKYKVLYPKLMSSSASKSVTLSGSLVELRLEGLVKKLDEIVSNEIYIEDDSKYLERSMRQLTDAVIGRLKERFSSGGDTNRPDFAVFAGRGFMFAPFKSMMEEELKSYFKDIQFKHFSRSSTDCVTDKNVCLVIANFLREGSYDTRLIGQPYMLHDNPALKNNSVNTSTEPKLWLVKKIKKIKNFIDSIGSNSDDFTVSVQKGYRAQETMKLSDFTSGITLHANANSDQILIGNIRHVLPNAIKLSYDFEMFFANGHIWIRQNGSNSMQLGRGLDFGGNRIFESLFPYVKVSKSDSVPIPEEISDNSTYRVPTVEEKHQTSNES